MDVNNAGETEYVEVTNLTTAKHPGSYLASSSFDPPTFVKLCYKTTPVPSGLLHSCMVTVSHSLFFPLFSSPFCPLANISPDSFVCQDPGNHGYQLALYEHLIPHLNIPSYPW